MKCKLIGHHLRGIYNLFDNYLNHKMIRKRIEKLNNY